MRARPSLVAVPESEKSALKPPALLSGLRLTHAVPIENVDPKLSCNATGDLTFEILVPHWRESLLDHLRFVHPLAVEGEDGI